MKPRSGYFFGRDNLPWQEKSISADEETKPEECLGYGKKTIYFLSDTDGTLTILVDPVGDGDFQTYDTVSVTANNPVTYVMTGGTKYVKLKFSASAKVSAKYVFEY